MKHDGSDFQFTFTNTGEVHFSGQTRVVIGSGTFYMAERTAAQSDFAGLGQLWIKNTTPCQLWFTDDAGTDTQIV